MALLASNASISLKSVFSKPFTINHFQSLPPLVDLPIVPLLPLTQITWLLTTLKPRRDVLVPDVKTCTMGSFWALPDDCNNKRGNKNINIRAILFIVRPG